MSIKHIIALKVKACECQSSETSVIWPHIDWLNDVEVHKLLANGNSDVERIHTVHVLHEPVDGISARERMHVELHNTSDR